MPDISMCMNHKCPHKAQCYRYRAIPDKDWQSYCDYHPNEHGCDYFWDIQGYEMVSRPVKAVENETIKN